MASDGEKEPQETRVLLCLAHKMFSTTVQLPVRFQREKTLVLVPFLLTKMERVRTALRNVLDPIIGLCVV